MRRAVFGLPQASDRERDEAEKRKHDEKMHLSPEQAVQASEDGEHGGRIWRIET